MPGVLKAKVDGTWVPIVGPGQGIPPGGNAGDVLLKNTISPYDVSWMQVVPKLTFGGETSQYPKAVVILDAAHATSRRATITIGSGWEIDADMNGNGVKDWGLLQMTNARWALRVDSTGRVFGLGDGSAQVDLYIANWSATPNLATMPRVSSNGSWLDMHAATDTYIDGDTIYFRSAAYGTKMTLDSGSSLTVQGNVTALGSLYTNGQVYSGTNQWFRVRGNSGLYWEDYGGGWQMTDATWVRAYNGKGIYTTSAFHTDGGSQNMFRFANTGFVFNHWSDNDTGLYYYGDGNIALCSNNSAVIRAYATTYAVLDNAHVLRLYGQDDGNHELRYYNGTPTGSGEANNGPFLKGYTSVWLYNIAYNKSLYLSSNGNVFCSAGSQFTVFSSREMKHNIKTLDPERALLMVKRWRPVEYDWNEDLQTPHPHGFGFIAEEHAEILPEMCNVYGEGHDHRTDPEGSEHLDIHRPGWANAVDYAGGVPWLAGAIQALLLRVEDLESRLEERQAA